MSELRYLQIYHDLMQLIESGELSVGSYLPSVSDLRSQYGVSHVTVLRSFQKLSENGMITRSPGKGYYVSDYAASCRHLPCFGALFRNISNIRFDQFYNSVMSSLQEESALKGYGLIFSSAASRGLKIRKLLESDALYNEALAMSSMVDGYFLDEWIPDQLVSRILHKTGKPGVIINRPSELEDIQAVYPDYQTALDKLYATLFRLGYRHFILCDSNFDIWSALSLRRGFQRLIRDYELKDNHYYIFNKVQHGTYEKVFSDFLVYWEQHRGERMVFLTIDDVFAQSMIRFFEARGVLVQKDYGVVGMHGLDSAYTRTELATLQVDTAEMGRKAARILLNSAAQPESYTVNVELIFGESI